MLQKRLGKVTKDGPHLNVCVLDEAEVQLDGEQLHRRNVHVQLLFQQVAPSSDPPAVVCSPFVKVLLAPPPVRIVSFRALL